MAGLKITGDVDGLKKFITNAHKIAGGTALKEMSSRLGKQGRELAAHTFAASQSPDGSAWEKLRAKTSRKPLVKSGKLSRSIKVRIARKGFELYSNVAYAAVHQYGGATKERTVARAKTGRFKSKKAASKAKRVVLVGRVKAGVIPARPYFPGDHVPDKWNIEFQKTAIELLKELFGE
jgi:phage gpG-like protein